MSSSESVAAGTTAAPVGIDLSEKQTRILGYLREQSGTKTYFKSRLIAEELGLSAKEVGANMRPLLEENHDLSIEKWGYSSGTTWKVSR